MPVKARFLRISTTNESRDAQREPYVPRMRRAQRLRAGVQRNVRHAVLVRERHGGSLGHRFVAGGGARPRLSLCPLRNREEVNVATPAEARNRAVEPNVVYAVASKV